jgi:hypothetical protein
VLDLIVDEAVESRNRRAGRFDAQGVGPLAECGLVLDRGDRARGLPALRTGENGRSATAVARIRTEMALFIKILSELRRSEEDGCCFFGTVAPSYARS